MCIRDRARYFVQRRCKLPVEPVIPIDEESYLNQRGGKVYFDSKKQPLLQLHADRQTFDVLSVGVDQGMTPSVTVLQNKKPAVSYTHLDVYKRQMLSNSPIRRSFAASSFFMDCICFCCSFAERFIKRRTNSCSFSSAKVTVCFRFSNTRFSRTTALM